jgi:hypothetical protein
MKTTAKMEAFPPLAWIDGTANRDKNATKRQIDEVVDQSTIEARPFFKRKRFYPPWNLPSIQRFDSPETSISGSDFFPHEFKWDDKTTSVDTFDVLCDTNFFGHDVGKNLIRGEFLLLYTGPKNLRQTLVNAKLQRSRQFLPDGCGDSKVSALRKVIPLNKLAQLINDTVKSQRKYFGFADVALSFEQYVNKVLETSELGGLTSLISRLRTPYDFWSYFKPLGFLHSMDGKPSYEGNACPLLSIQHRGLSYTSHLPGKFAPTGARLYYAVGMTNAFNQDERLVENAAFNYPRPTLVYVTEDTPKNLVRQCGFVSASRENCTAPSLFKYVGNFVSNYRPVETNTARSPYLQVDMLRSPFSVYS